MTDPTWITPADPATPVARSVLEWLYLKSQADELVARANLARDAVTRAVCASDKAVADDRGHLWLDLDSPLRVGESVYTAIKREKRVTRLPSEQRAEEFAEKHDLVERLFPMRPVFNEAELYVLYQEGLISEVELDDLYDVRTTWALKAVAA